MQLGALLALSLATTSTTTAPPYAIGFVPGRGLVLEVPGRAQVALGTHGQVLYTVEDSPDTGDQLEQSLQLRRLRLSLSGYFFEVYNQYKVELAFAPREGRQSPLLDAYYRFSYLRDLNLQIGQYKLPFSRERLNSITDLNMVDLSIVDGEFGLERDIGLDLRSDDLFGLRLLRYDLGVFIGEGRNSFDFSDFGLAYLARVEVLPFGLFDERSQPDLARLPEPRLSIGASYVFIDRAHRDRGIQGAVPVDGGTTDVHVATADLAFLFEGLSVLLEVFYRRGIRNPPPGAPEVAPARNAWGFMLQPGYLLPWLDLELVGRFARIIPYGSSDVTLDSELGAGLNDYFLGHCLKLQADYFHRWWTNDLGNGSDTFRLQLQAGF